MVESGYCPAHQEQTATKTYDQQRGTPVQRGYDSEWRRVRLDALKRDNFLCVLCLQSGRTEPAKDVDHITPISADPSRRLNLTNLQSLCRACHTSKTAKDRISLPKL